MVLQMARSCLKAMVVPDVLWGEALSRAVYVLNRPSTKALDGTTAYDLWIRRKSYFGHLRVFGCVAHMKVAKGHLKKLDN